MSWIALLPTIVVALIVAGMVLFESRRTVSADTWAGAGDDVAPDGALPTFGSGLRDIRNWLRNARKPVWPVDYSDFNARVRRGFKLAGLMGIAAALLSAAQPHQNSMGGVLLLIGLVLAGAMFIAFACIVSVVHSIIIQILPYRGPIVSTALGVALGFAAAFFAAKTGDASNRAMIWLCAIYGALMGFVELSHGSSVSPAGTRRERSKHTR